MEQSDISIKRAVQLRQLEILKEAHRICVENSIDYYLINGSALGAVRHNGFIPWDDDVDIALFRRDYDKLIALCQSELKENYFLQTNQSDPEYYLAYAKIRINGTIFKESFYDQINMHHGIFIDIFPLDTISDSNFISTLQYYFVRLLNYLVLLKYKRIRTIKSFIIRFLFSPVVFFMSQKKLLNMINKVIFFPGNRKTKKAFNYFGGYSNKKDSFSPTIFGNAKLMIFEDDYYPIPEKWNEYLTQLYGDYMKLPSENERVGHEIIQVEF